MSDPENQEPQKREPQKKERLEQEVLENASQDPVFARALSPLKGQVKAPGDKSISHRAFMLGLLAHGTTHIKGLLEAEDIMATKEACRALGAHIVRLNEGEWRVTGVGIGALVEPEHPLDFGNAGTGVRLMMGILGSHAITVTCDGDGSLRKRPMKRIIDPLYQMGVRFDHLSDKDRLPLKVIGSKDPTPITYTPPMASAQVKSVILLAGLNTPGETTVIETVPTRDHTERMLLQFGAELTKSKLANGNIKISLKGQPHLTGQDITVPSDPSSAAFPLVAALIVPNSEIILRDVMLNPSRTGLITTLQEMGGNITLTNQRETGGEMIADLAVRASRLKGIDVPAERAASMIDEYPVLAMAASCADGTTRMQGLDELRVKESDRIQAIYDGLIISGVKARIEGDDLIVTGGAVPGGGAPIPTYLDHRIAMSFLVLSLVSSEPITIDDKNVMATSFPNFMELMSSLGAEFHDYRN